MAKVFDFNALRQNTLETRLGGPNNTVVHVTTPPERLIEQMAASQGELNKLMNSENADTFEQSRVSYELAAKLISCNTEGVTVTADDLRDEDKYNIAPAALAVYLAAYMDFINEFHNAKN